MLGTDLSFDLYHDGYIREVIGAVHYVDHPRKELSVKDLKGDTWFIEFDSLYPLGHMKLGDDPMTDFERKVYQIIVNMHLYGKNPTLDDLKSKTGKSMMSLIVVP